MRRPSSRDRESCQWVWAQPDTNIASLHNNFYWTSRFQSHPYAWFVDIISISVVILFYVHQPLERRVAPFCCLRIWRSSFRFVLVLHWQLNRIAFPLLLVAVVDFWFRLTTTRPELDWTRLFELNLYLERDRENRSQKEGIKENWRRENEADIERLDSKPFRRARRSINNHQELDLARTDRDVLVHHLNNFVERRRHRPTNLNRRRSNSW